MRSQSKSIPAKRRSLNRQIAEDLPLLRKMDPQHGRERIGQASSTLDTGLGTMGLHQINQCSDGLQLLHLNQKARFFDYMDILTWTEWAFQILAKPIQPKAMACFAKSIGEYSNIYYTS
jgi:hypothetical protein